MHEKIKSHYLSKVLAKILIFCMILQGMPLMQLGQAYEWRFKPERLKILIDLLGPASAEAAPPKVVCVPQLPTDLLVPHETWSGEPTILKSVARDPDNNLSGGSYYWDLGDGTSTPPAAITNADNLSVTHTYSEAPGTLIVARLHVTDAAGETSSDDYRILVKAKTLDVEVKKAIDDGLWWLYTNKKKRTTAPFYPYWDNTESGWGSTGFWGNATASAIQAFEINGHLETGDPDQDPYAEVVHWGLRGLFTNLVSVNIPMQGGGNPDANGNGIGLYWNYDRSSYETGAVMDALVASGTPDAIAAAGGVNVVGRRYQDIVQDMVDAYAWGQADSGYYKGGWRYSWNADADNSACQWGAIGMIAAERHFGCIVPQWVKDQNNVWLNTSYGNPGFGYSGPGTGWATTPSGMVQLAFVNGAARSDGATAADTRWQTAENWIASNWNSFLGWNVPSKRQLREHTFYAHYAFAKAMRLAVPQEVVHLLNGLDWYGDEQIGLARLLVDLQNANGSWPYDWPYVGTRIVTAWNVIILTRTLFEKPPVAVIHAEPNPGAMGQQIVLDASGSYHVDPAKTIVGYFWDFDAADGVDFTNPDAEGVNAAVTYGDLRDYTVSLKVVDDSTPQRFDTASITVHITIPPHPPTAVIAAPYIAVVGEPVAVDGSGSYDVDEPAGDQITAWEWEVDFVAPYNFAEATGETPVLDGFGAAGNYDIALRVTDNTAEVFPQSGSPNLTHVAFGRVQVYRQSVNDLAARPKATKCQLTWTHVGAAQYEVLRSERGPNHGYGLIGTTASTYSTFIDYNVTMDRDYWYRIRFVENDETFLSGPVYMKSAGRIRNLPPVITSDPVTSAQEGQLYRYAVTATDPEGSALTYVLDQAPAGMTIDSALGLISWTPTFAQVGQTDVTVRVNDALMASTTQFFQIMVFPRPNTAPVADPGGPYTGMINTAVRLDASASTDPEGDPITAYRWVFGDGNEGSGSQTDHTYTAPGTYTVTLFVTDDRGATGQAETVCQIEAPNRPPVAVISGMSTGEAGVPIAFNALGSFDPDDDSLIYTWNFGDSTPAETGDMVIHTFADAGTYMVSLTADDGRGGLDTAELIVTIDPSNEAPTAAFTVSGNQNRLQTLTFDASASSDPEGNPLTAYEWDFGDGGTTTGQIVTHVFNSVGDFTVILTVTDGKGAVGTVQQGLAIAESLVVVPDVVGLNQAAAEAGITGAGLVVGNVTTQYSVPVPAGSIISQNPMPGASVIIGFAVDMVLSLGPEPGVVPEVVGMSQSVAQTTITAAGYSVGGITTQLSDTVPAGLVISQAPEAGTLSPLGTNVNLVVSLGSQPQPPEISVSLPSGLTIEGSYELMGTICSPSLIRYEIELSPQGSSSFRVVDDGNTCVENGVLGVIDPTLLPNGLYDLRISAYDAVGNVYRGLSGEPIEISSKIKIGPFNLGFEDITIPVSGIPITVTRTYNSFDKEKGDFGIGWDMLLGSGVKIQVTRTLGYNWYADYDYCFQWFFGQCLAWVYKLMTPNVPKVLVTYADGRQERFEFRPVFSTQPALDPEWVTAAFTPLEGTTSTLQVAEMDQLILMGGENGDTLYDSDMEPFDPDLFRLTTAEGMVLIISRSEGLKSITDLNGNTLTFGPNGITHSSGVAIGMQRDTGGRITRITDPMGHEVRYSYDDKGDLTAFTDQGGNITRYGYDEEHNLTSIVDPQGIEILHTQYDELGRMIGTVDGLGNTIVFTHDTENAIEFITDRNGNTTAYEYDGDGNVIAVTDPLGNLTAYAYDARGNTLSKTDALGNVTRWSYDAKDNKLSEIDPLGNTTYWTYNSRNQVLTTTDPLGKVEINLYDGNGNLLSKTDAMGDKTAYTYDSRGNRLTKIDCEGNVWTYTYDERGNKLTETDPLGNVTAFTYDLNGNILTETDARGRMTTRQYDSLGHLIRTTDPLGNVATAEYNAPGKKIAEVDKNGNRTEYKYDANGNLIRTMNPDGTTEVDTYDANGNRLTATDRAGRVTQYAYDALKYGDPEKSNRNRLICILYSDGARSGFEYDALGRMTAAIDENGNRTEYEYDGAGRMIRTIDGLGNETTFAYDANGNQISLTDANGNTMLFNYDALGRLIKTTFPDGTISTTAYAPARDDIKRKLSETDQAGKSTLYDYDALGRLTRITDAMGNIITYTYDAVGNRVAQTDALGRTTSFTYDALNKVLTRTLPLGQTEVFTYDANGNRVAKTDFNGNTTAYTYDAMNRLIRKQYPDATEATFAYTAMGKQKTVTDSWGTTSSTYDERDRILSITHPDGSTISYTYDKSGNRASVTVPSGKTAYTYDALNRLSSVIDPDGRMTTYTYDGVGNLTKMTYPNGAIALYTYDSLNRLVSLVNRDFSDAMISSYTYVLGAAGNRLKVTENSGRTVAYTYDDLYRLIHENITDPVLGDETIAYTYDAAGNRLTKVDSNGTTNYTYDAGDQLITETGGGYATTCTYDLNGNTVGKSDGISSTTYSYDYENRLIGVQEGSQVTAYTYDTDGNRVSVEFNGAPTYYLVDKNRPYPQVLEERDASDSLAVSYTYGNDLISQNRSGVLSCYHYDGQMSTRQLTDDAGGVTDTYIYDAFGITLDQTGSTANSYLYTGEQYDPNVGFYYLRARYLNPETGRFLTHDPLSGNIFDPISLHRYLYANVDPVNKFDPSGMISLTETQIAIAVMSILTAISVQSYVETKYNNAALGIFCGALAGAFAMAFALEIASGLLVSAATPAATISQAQVAQDFNTMKEAIAAGQVGRMIAIGQDMVRTPVGRQSIQKTLDYAWTQAAAQGRITPQMREIINALEIILGRP